MSSAIEKSSKTVFVESNVLLFYLLVAFIILRKIIITKGAIAMVGDWNIPVFTNQFKDWLAMEFYSWNPYPDLGALSGSSGLFLKGFFYLISLFFNDYAVVKVGVLIILALCGWSMYYLCVQTGVRHLFAFLSGFFYMFTPFVFDRLATGLLFIVFSYALMPLALALFMQTFKNKDHYRLLFFTGIVSAITASNEAHLIILPAVFILFLLLKTIGSKGEVHFLKDIRNIVVLFLIIAMLHAFWIVPLIKDVFAGSFNEIVSNTLGQFPVRFHVSVSAPIDTMRMGGFHIPYMFEEAGKWRLWQGISILLPIFAFMVFVFESKNWNGVFFAFLAIIGIFVSSAGYVFGYPWLWLLENIPLFGVFRDADKWISLTCLGYGVLIGMLLQNLQDYCMSTFIKHHE